MRIRFLVSTGVILVSRHRNVLSNRITRTARGNAAMTYKNIELNPVSAALGAEVQGVDLSTPLDEATLKEIKDAWLEYLVLFFRDQDLTPAQFKAFVKNFGDIRRHSFIDKVDGDEDVEELNLAKAKPMAPPTTILHVDVSIRVSPDAYRLAIMHLGTVHA